MKKEPNPESSNSVLVLVSQKKGSCGRRRDNYHLTMSIAELRKLPRSEKLKIVETLWSDLVADDDSFESPAWHEEELRKTEADLAAGRIKERDWEEAKQELRKRFG